MIIDTLTKLTRISSNPKLKPAFDFLRDANSATENKRYYFDEERLFVIVKSCDTLAANADSMESHRRCIDVHYNLVGSEGLMWTPLVEGKLKTVYSSQIDAALYHGPGRVCFTLPVGHFAAFFPEDVHGTEVAVGPQGAPLKKAIIKIQLDLLKA